MQKICFLLTMLFVVSYGYSQTTEDSVKAAVNKLFDGMKNADRALLIESFADSAVLQTINRNGNGNVMIRDEKVREFAEQVGKSQKGSLDERIEFGSIKIDADLASVWTPYKFYYNGKFSHCGVNSFQLVRINGQWKIQYLIDTRRKSGCD